MTYLLVLLFLYCLKTYAAEASEIFSGTRYIGSGITTSLESSKVETYAVTLAFDGRKSVMECNRSKRNGERFRTEIEFTPMKAEASTLPSFVVRGNGNGQDFAGFGSCLAVGGCEWSYSSDDLNGGKILVREVIEKKNGPELILIHGELTEEIPGSPRKKIATWTEQLLRAK